MKKLQRYNNGKNADTVKRGPTVPVRVSPATRDALAPQAEAEGVSVGEIIDQQSAEYPALLARIAELQSELNRVEGDYEEYRNAQ